ncbi:hypothetical protein BS78_09G180000 [Paspalum vaginatum]|nr:hypothetical protein BS78_09G180000 [Paspalum vaginatum]
MGKPKAPARCRAPRFSSSWSRPSDAASGGFCSIGQVQRAVRVHETRRAASFVPPSDRKRRRIAFGSADHYEEISRARDHDSGKEVAIKRFAHGGHSEVIREASVLGDACASGGGNPIVVDFHGVVLDPATSDLCIVMEFVGPGLHDVIRKNRAPGCPPLPEAAVRAAMFQLLTGACKMHAADILHRDIKPQNILVGDGAHSVLKFCDFGLAMSLDDPPPYEAVGTMWYKTLELLLEKTDYDSRVDTWALGCVMAELINKKPLFQGFHEDGQLCAIFDVLGVPDDATWPWFSSTPSATVVAPELDMPRSNSLREVFPEAKLSDEGFQVLRSLLTCNPEKRLTAAAALKLPWFAKIDELKLPKKEEATPLLPKLPKKRRMHAVMCV